MNVHEIQISRLSVSDIIYQYKRQCNILARWFPDRRHGMAILQPRLLSEIKGGSPATLQGHCEAILVLSWNTVPVLASNSSTAKSKSIWQTIPRDLREFWTSPESSMKSRSLYLVAVQWTQVKIFKLKSSNDGHNSYADLPNEAQQSSLACFHPLILVISQPCAHLKCRIPLTHSQPCVHLKCRIPLTHYLTAMHAYI